MAPPNPRFHSPDPEDPSGSSASPGARDARIDPLDQANANDAIGTPHLEHHPREAPLDVRALRKRMKMTQRQFAGWFGFPVATLRHWERGNRKPSGTAFVLLNVIRDNPRVVLQAVRKARFRDPGSIAMIESRTSFRAPPG